MLGYRPLSNAHTLSTPSSFGWVTATGTPIAASASDGVTKGTNRRPLNRKLVPFTLVPRRRTSWPHRSRTLP
jgi:hypothetical protein